MAAVTVGSHTSDVWGSKRVEMFDLSSIDNADTLVTGLQIVDQIFIMPTAAAATTQIGATVSGGTITFAVESGSLAAKLTAIGS